jgi:hypothetical protein
MQDQRCILGRGGNTLPLCRVRWSRRVDRGPAAGKIYRLRELAFCCQWGVVMPLSPLMSSRGMP